MPPTELQIGLFSLTSSNKGNTKYLEPGFNCTASTNVVLFVLSIVLQGLSKRIYN